MAFSSTDLANIESAMVDLATGKRVVMVDVGGKTRQFQSVDLNKLQKLRDMVKADINSSSGTGFVNSVSFKDAT